jgi:hypothetical protein
MILLIIEIIILSYLKNKKNFYERKMRIISLDFEKKVR